MRVLFLSPFWTVLLDIVVWALLHLAFSCWATRRDGERFSVEKAWYKPRRWETDSRLYRLLGVRVWKAYLPDAAPWISGIPKRRLPGKDRAALCAFLIETCRGECSHWLVFCCGPLFFLWNKAWVGVIMLLYAAISNIPCILVQRYNRARLWRILNSDTTTESISRP